MADFEKLGDMAHGYGKKSTNMMRHNAYALIWI